jgi:hypothetical protein
MFVVIALRSARGTPQPMEAIEAYATPTVVHFATVLFLAGFIMVPEQTELSLGLCFAAAGLAGFAYSVWVTFQARSLTSYADFLSDWIWRSVLPCLGYAGIALAAPVVWWDTAAALYVAAAVALLFSPWAFTTPGTRRYGLPATTSDSRQRRQKAVKGCLSAGSGRVPPPMR